MVVVCGSTLEEQMEKCIQDFYRFYNLDQYISKKNLDAFIAGYEELIGHLKEYYTKENELYKKIWLIYKNGQDMINIKNRKYVERHMKEDKEYFDHLFDQVDSSILLDEEQRKAILIDEDYSLIIAGAGSGKTTTMAAKVKYLIEKKKVDPKQIILLSYTKKACEELDLLLNEKFKLNVEVVTFHKLGMNFIKRIFNRPVEVIGDSGVYAILSDYFTEVIFKNKALLKEYQNCFGEFLRLEDFCFSYETYEDYYEKYIEYRINHCEDIKTTIKRRIQSRQKRFHTINGEYVKSEGEVQIANYLYKRGIPYEYEALYPYSVGYLHSYHPDFTIHDGDASIYVEYYGLAKLGSDGSIISNEKEYAQNILDKRKVHQENKTDCIELFGRYENKDYFLPCLSLELKKRDIPRFEKSDEEIYRRLLETGKSSPYYGLISFLAEFLHLFKDYNYQLKDFEYFKNSAKDDMVKRQLRLVEHAYLYYEKHLHGQNKIDFSDMINYAYYHISQVKSKDVLSPYAYIIIDEYQDISSGRHQFMKKLSDLFQAKIVAVGDDWQTIFSFSGSNIQLFTHFYELMGYGEVIKITNTYRNSQELINLAGEFIGKNNEQIEKSLKSKKHLEHPVEIVNYDYSKEKDNLAETLSHVIGTIYEQNPQDKILLLIRFNEELEGLLDSKLFYKRTKGESEIVCKKYPKAKVDLLTVHKAKGLGYDQVILLNGLNLVKGFPSQMKDHDLIKLIKQENENEPIKWAEERRLFYVAMTRTKNKLYILAPIDREYRSDFIKEIETSEYVTYFNDK